MTNGKMMAHTGESEAIKEWIFGLLDGNPALTGSEAKRYAAAILIAEQREDRAEMNSLIQEALYAPRDGHACRIA
jgi:hypothetical protein